MKKIISILGVAIAMGAVFAVSSVQAVEPVDLQPVLSPISPINPRPGEHIAFNAQVKNNGSAASSGFAIKWYVDGVEVGYGGHDSVGAGVTLDSGNSGWDWWSAAPGTHTVKFVVDADNSIAETNESNNSAEVTFNVTGACVPTTENKEFHHTQPWTFCTAPIVGATEYLFGFHKENAEGWFYENYAHDRKWSYDGTWTIWPKHPKYDDFLAGETIKLEVRALGAGGWADSKFVPIKIKGVNAVTGSDYVLTTTTAGDGQGVIEGSGINCGADCTETYRSASNVTLIAKPTPGARFERWVNTSCLGSIYNTECTIRLDKHQTATAVFSGNNIISQAPPIDTKPVLDNKPTIKLLSPNGGETLQIGSDYTVRWETKNDLAGGRTILRIHKGKSDASELVYASIEGNPGSYIVRIPESASGYPVNSVPANNYYLTITRCVPSFPCSMYTPDSTLSVGDISDAPFTIRTSTGITENTTTLPDLVVTNVSFVPATDRLAVTYCNYGGNPKINSSGVAETFFFRVAAEDKIVDGDIGTAFVYQTPKAGECTTTKDGNEMFRFGDVVKNKSIIDVVAIVDVRNTVKESNDSNNIFWSEVYIPSSSTSSSGTTVVTTPISTTISDVNQTPAEKALAERLLKLELKISDLEQKLVAAEAALVKAIDKSLTQRLSGNILLQVEENGEAWYVDPNTGKKFYLKDGHTAYSALQAFGMGITDADLAKIPVGVDSRADNGVDTDKDGLADKLELALKTNSVLADSDNDGNNDFTEITTGYNPLGAGKLAIDTNLVERLKGRILLQVEANGQAWYVNPADGKRYYMTDGERAYQIMRYLSLGITNEDLRKIEVGQF